ncbi:MAG TPA: DinB family protein [Ilumatobacteraceae bacterium]|nr:DinB family protein [Ilumatobacteraceae bacterium]
MERVVELIVLDDVLDSLDQTWSQLSDRLDGLTVDEYLWEPAAGCWTVRADPDTGASVDEHDTEADPAPLTTIAWRMWHVAVDCLDSYSSRAFNRTGTGLAGTAWVLEPGEACDLLERAWRTFQEGLAEGGSDRLFEALGEGWGPYADSTVLALALHAQREVTHHGAEIALLRDLFRAGRS